MRKGSRCDGEESSCAAAAGGLPGMVAGVLQYVGTYYIYTRCKAGVAWVNGFIKIKSPPRAPPRGPAPGPAPTEPSASRGRARVLYCIAMRGGGGGRSPGEVDWMFR